MDDIKTISEFCAELRGGYANRDALIDAVARIYQLDMGDLPSGDHIKRTLSPDGRNAAIGAARLLTAADPKWSVPEDMNADLKAQSSGLEKLAEGIWKAAGRVQGKPRHSDITLSAILTDMVVVVPVVTADLVAMSKGGKRKRLEDVARRAPLLFNVLPAKSCFPLMDSLGMAAMHIRINKTVRDILDQYPQAEAALGTKKQSERFDLCEYWDYDQHYVWIDGKADAIVAGENPYGFIPVACTFIESSSLFEKNNQVDCQPFLYTVHKTGLWERQNLALTVAYSQMFAIGSNAQFLYVANDPDKPAPVADFSTPASVMKITAGESYGPLSKQVLDPSILTGLDIATQKVTESTIYRQTLGEPLAGNAPYSMVALLNSAGRLPLVPYQKMCSHVIGEAMAKGMAMLKITGGDVRVRTGKDGKLVEIKPDLIPDNVEIEAELEIDLPIDERQNAMLATQLTQGDNPILSVESARERYLQLEQPEDETNKIWRERAETARLMIWLQQQQQQGMQPQGQPGGMPMPPQGQPPMDPRMMQMLAQQQQGGMPMPPEGMPDEQSTGAEEGMPGMPLGAPLPPQGQEMI